MANDLTIQGDVVVTTEKAEAAFDRVGDKASHMATEVAKSATTASKAVDGIGDGAEKGAERFTRAEARMRDAIKKSTQELQTLGKTASEKLEFNIEAKGLDASKLAPYIAELKKAEEAQRSVSGSLDKMGMSAGQTRMALQQLPLQFQDIVVSLQAGQAPMTVMLQQGSQLAGSFGGVGAAAKAMSGYILGLVNPVTLVAGGVAALAVAYYQGSKESDAFVKSIALTGNASGVTTSQLREYARQIDSVVGTQAKAAEGLTAFVAAGVRGDEQLRQYTQTAIEWEKATGEAVDETAKKFADLQKDPLTAVLKLNEGTNFLTMSVYEQIKSFAEQGRSADASRVAMDALDAAMRDRSKTIKENLGYIEQGWAAIKGAAKDAWDAMLGVGRKATVGEQLAAAQQELANRKAKSDVVGDDAAWQRGNKSLENRIAALQGLIDKETAASKATADGAAQVKARAKWDEDGIKYLSKSAQMERELAIARGEANAAGVAGAALEERLAGIREKYKEKGATKSTQAYENEVAAIRARIVAEKELISRIEEHGTKAKEMSEADKLVAKLQEQVAATTDKRTKAAKEAALAEAKEFAEVQNSRIALQQKVKAQEEAEASYRKYIDSLYKSVDAVGAMAEKQEAANESYGKSKIAIAQMVAEQAKLAAQNAMDAGPWTPEQVSALTQLAAQHERYVASLKQAQFIESSRKYDEQLKTAKAENELQQYSMSLLGQEEVKRNKLIAIRKAELALETEIAEIRKKFVGQTLEDEETRNKLIAQARLAAEEKLQGDLAAIQNQYINEQVSKYGDIFRQGFADFVNNGTEGLKAFGKSLKTTILTSVADALYKAFAQKFVMNVVANISGGGWIDTLLGLVGMAGGGSGGGNNTLGLANNAHSAYSAVGAASQFLYGGSAGASSASLMYANGVGFFGGDSIGALYTANGGWAGVGTGGTAAGGSSGAAAGAGWGAAAAFAIPLIAAYLGGMFKEEKMVGQGLTGDLGGDLYGYQLMRESGGLFDGPDYRYLIAEKEIADVKAKIEAIKSAPDYDAEAQATAHSPLQNLYRKLEYLERDYGAAVENSQGPIKIIQDAFTAMRENTAKQADVLGLNGDSIRAMKVALGLDEIHPDTGGKGLQLTGLTQAEASAKIQEALKQANEELARSVLGSWQEQTREVTKTIWEDVYVDNGGDYERYERVGRRVTETITEQVFVMSEYVREGETAVQALTRLSDSLVSVNTVFDLLGVTLMDASLAGADMASEIIDAFGGADKFAAATGNYYDKFYTDQEKAQNQTRLLNAELKKLGIDTMPANREELRKYINGIDLSTEAGQKLYASLLGLVDVFDAIYSSAENIASMKEDLNVQLLRAQGKDAEALKIEREKQIKELEKYNDPGLVKLQRDVWAAEDANTLKEQAKSNLDAAISREKEYWNQFSSDAKDALAKASSYFTLVTGAAASLRGSVSDVATMQAAAGMVFIEQALEQARAGFGLSDYDKTKTAIDAANSGLVMDNYATQAELDYDKKVLAGQLDELGKYADLAKSDTQKQIDIATAQVKKLDETLAFWQNYGKEQIDATMSVADAIKALEQLFAPEPSGSAAGATGSGSGGAVVGGSGYVKQSTVVGYTTDGRVVYSDGSVSDVIADSAAGYLKKGENPYGVFGGGKGVVWDDEKKLYVPKFDVGTNWIPNDMLAMVHKGERIIPAADNRALMSALSNQGQSSGNAELIAAVNRLEQRLASIESGQQEVAYQARKTASVLSNVTDGGNAMRNLAVTA